MSVYHQGNDNGGKLPVLPISGHNPHTPDKRKVGRGRIRATVLILVHVVILLHIMHYFWWGRSLSPIEPSEAMYAIELGYLNAGAVFFFLAILSTAVFGRFFCGWGCHLVALQDLCGYLLRKMGLRVKPLRSRLLVMIPFAVAFYMFFWPTVKRIWNGDRHPGFSNHLMTDNFWATFPGPVVSVTTFVVCGGLMVYLLGNKGFCTYACPYGAFFSIADVLAWGRIRVTDACQHCGQCTAHCTSNVKVHAEVKQFSMVVDSGCMKCLDCVSVCPNDALYYGFSPFQAAVSDIDVGVSKDAAIKRTYDFTIGEELVGLVIAMFSIFALRGLYDLTPFLLSVALGAITAYLAIQFGRIFRKPDFRLQHFQIKRRGSLTSTGYAAICLLIAWFLFNIHSFVVQYHRLQARGHLIRIDANWAEVLVAPSSFQFSPQQKSEFEMAHRNLEITDQFSLLPVMEVKLGLAVTSIVRDDVDVAESYLRAAYDCKPGAMRELLMEFLVSQGRPEEARELLR